MNRNDVLRVLKDPIAQELMQSRIPARLAYTAPDGTPRVIPIGFLWKDERLVICTIPGSPKVSALRANPKVALTIDTDSFPPHVLLVRGTATLRVVQGVPPEYLEAARKQIDDEGMPAFEEQVRALYKQMVRIDVEPEWAKVMDFETRLPSDVERLMKQQQVAAR